MRWRGFASELRVALPRSEVHPSSSREIGRSGST
jgi:hypothetical protein